MTFKIPKKRASLSHDQMQALVTECILDYHKANDRQQTRQQTRNEQITNRGLR